MVRNGQTLHITYTGNTSFQSVTNKIYLNNVLVVPEIKKNLLSVSQMTSEFPYVFDKTVSQVTHLNISGMCCDAFAFDWGPECPAVPR